MGFSERLKQIMSDRNVSAKQLSADSDTPLSTIYSILQRDSSRVDINSVIRIAHALEITADELLETELGKYKPPVSLSGLELELINRYRKARPGIRESVEKLLDIDEGAKRKAESLGA